MAPPARLARALAALVLITAPAHVAAQQPKRPPAESRAVQLTVPPVPSFELPPGEPGVRTVRELRTRGWRDWLGTEITVRGYITWIYDCEKAIARPGETPAQVKRRIYDDQTLCERPKFYLGDAKDTRADRAIWVVAVPRPPTQVERNLLPKTTLAQWPAVPKLALGDHVAITGTWARQSPHGDRNSDGLLVFKAMQPASPAPPAPAPASAARPVPAAPAAAPPKVPPAPPPVRIDPAKRQAAIRQANAGAMALASNDFDAAIREYRAAVATWPEHDAAWYYLAHAYVRKQDYRAAVVAAANATRLAPDVAMYRLMYGLGLYEAERQRVREAQAAAQGRTPEEVVPDAHSQNHDAALAQLVLAIHLDGDVWRAHYYCGRIYRDRGDARRAAVSFSDAVRRAPAMAAPYVALADLYRRWDYFDPAMEVTRLGATTLTAPEERADVLYMLALSHEDKREDGAAIEAYTQALEAKPDLAQALFQRGQVYARMKKSAAAKADLEAYLAHPGASGWEKGTAQRILSELGSKKR